MSIYEYSLAAETMPPMGLVVLQTDETIEGDMRRLLGHAQLYITRVASGLEVTPETLQQMASEITGAVELLPQAQSYGVVGYGCTSGSAQIGPSRIAQLVKSGTETDFVTEPVSALTAACKSLNIKRLGFLSPYIADVSDRLRDVLGQADIQTPVFGSFAEAQEAKVVRIDGASIIAAACDLCAGQSLDALFLSCTNLRTLDVIDVLEDQLSIPVLSSNLVLAWDMARRAGASIKGPGKLLNQTRD